MNRILVAGDGQYEWFAPAWVKGLQTLGCDVEFIDWSKLSSSGPLGRLESRFMVGPGICRINAELERSARRVKPDVVLIHNGYPVRTETVARVAKEHWVTGFHHDDPFGRFGRRAYFRLYRRAIPFYNSHHVIRQENVVEYRELGVQHVKILMTYYVPWLHVPFAGPGSRRTEWDRDVVFIGHGEPDHRIGYVKTLVEAGIGLQIFGPQKYWREYLPTEVYRRLPAIRPVVRDEYARTICRSKICLAFFSRGNRDRYAYRVFEIPACGGFLLAERSDVMMHLYKEGTEAEFFASSEELIDKTRFYVQNEEARGRIARRGYERCTTGGYDVISRMKQWSADIKEFRG